MKSKLVFPDGLTPQKHLLLRRVRDGITNRILVNSDLMLALLFFRESKVSDLISEWGHSVAHGERDQGWAWEKAVDAWAVHSFVKRLVQSSDEDKLGLLYSLPRPVFRAMIAFLESKSQNELDFIASRSDAEACPKKEIIATLYFLYPSAAEIPTKDRKNRERSRFLKMANSPSLDDRDVQLVFEILFQIGTDLRELEVLRLEHFVLELERVFKHFGFKKNFSLEECLYLEMHLLTGFHGTILSVNEQTLSDCLGVKMRGCVPVLCVGAMSDVLSLDICLCYIDEEGHLETEDFHEEWSRTSSPLHYQPVVISNLEEKTFLHESDLNIRSTLYNHSIEVACIDEENRLVVLDRERCRFTPFDV